MTAVSADFDDDGWPDIFVACDSTPSILLPEQPRRHLHGHRARSSAWRTTRTGASRPAWAWPSEMSGHGRLDIFKTHFADDTPILYRNKGKGVFEDITGRAGLGTFTRYVGWGAGFADFDNDGLPDLLFVNGNVYPEVKAVRRIQIQESADGAAQPG